MDLIIIISLLALIISIYAAWSARITENMLDKMIGIVEKILDVMIEEGDHDYEQASDYRDHCEQFESTYNPEDGSM